MRRLSRHACRGLAAVVVLAMTACGGGGSERRPAAAPTTTTTTSATTVPSAPVTTAAPSTTTTRPHRAVVNPATTTTISGAPASGFAPAGTYRYRTTGSFTSSLGTQRRDGEATLTVDPPAGADQHSVRRGLGRTTEQVLRLDGGDALLVSLHLVDTGVDKEVRPSPPALALPGDAAPGRAWSWRATTTDGLTTVDATFRAARTEDVAVGADRVRALVVEATLAFSGDVTSTSTQTMWVAVDRRLVVRQDEATQGRLGLLTFSSTSSDVLESLTPL